MKRKVKVSIMFSLMLIALFNIKSFAAMEVENYEINCEVTVSGNMNVQENITYKLDGYISGVNRNIDVRNDRNINNSADKLVLNSVKINGNEQERVAFATRGRSGIYEYKIKDDNYDIKVFETTREDKITVTYEYTLENVIIKYNDTAELYWNYISDKWDTNINNLGINITLPINSVDKEIYTFGYGTENGEIEKQQNEIKIKLKDIKAYQPIDVRVLFNQDSLIASNKTVERAYLKKYDNKEQGFIKNREEIKVAGVLTVKQIMFFSIGIIIITWVGIYLVLRNRSKENKKNTKWHIITSASVTGIIILITEVVAIILNDFSMSVYSGLLAISLIATAIIFNIWFRHLDFTNKFMCVFTVIVFLVFQYLNIMLCIGNELILMYVPYLISFALVQYTLRMTKESKEVEDV